jgi:hypothetical protein
VLLTVGRDKGLIDERLFTLFALMAITTTLLTSPALRRLTRPGTRAVLTPGGEAGDPTGKVPGFNAPGWSRGRRAGGGLP